MKISRMISSGGTPAMIEHVSVRLSAEEKNAALRAAEEKRMTVTAFIRAAVREAAAA